jgi:hypothetical protein
LGGGEGGGIHVGLSQQKVRYGPPHVEAHGTPTKRPVTERPITKRPVTGRSVTGRLVIWTFGNWTFGNWTFGNWTFCNWTFRNWRFRNGTFCGWPRVADPILNPMPHWKSEFTPITAIKRIGRNFEYSDIEGKIS